MEKIYYKVPEYSESEHSLEVNQLECFIEADKNYIGRLRIGELPFKYVTVELKKCIRGTELKFYTDIGAYMNKLPFQKFINKHPKTFRLISKEQFVKVL